ncbi:SGNH/GDSL hydrolase family protein [Heyndrickxia sp. MSNUG]|uniref:SGNH/GDSL hydrolase family protein n=1 Tax=Heyndrickxia sp. MSNUG TaxID=3136677 RepID=UPI003C2B8E31
MKAFFTTLLAIVCMGVLLWGNIHWTQKTTVTAKKNESPVVTETEKNKEVKKEDTEAPSNSLVEFTKNWPIQGVEGFQKSLEDKRPYKILMIGSKALGEEQSGWAALTKEKLLETYDEKYMNVDIQVFDETSRDFVNNDGAETIIDGQADMVLFEPFTLMDNGEVSIEDSLNNIQTVMDETLEANPETVFILMPPHPIYNATFYPKQVEALKGYAEDNKIAYLDHWEAWPDFKTEEVKEYITSDNSQPNEQGHELWSKFMTGYLISK